eukprot:TRINITY_DN7754_c0_g1_i1.p1 TRINITY_DN7754_c0_g1~~TRINITY_DN7754_c0_g1_i1.p1  ORF type:complete len:517 (+),score=119.48 TRINITY_DN7754_c0_g1_i1:171-1553(+)
MSDIQDQVIHGDRPDIPEVCPRRLQRILSKSWHRNPKRRPSWNWIIGELTKVISVYTESNEAYSNWIFEEMEKRRHDISRKERTTKLEIWNEKRAKQLENISEIASLGKSIDPQKVEKNRMLLVTPTLAVYKQWEEYYLMEKNWQSLKFYLDIIVLHSSVDNEENVREFINYIVENYFTIEENDIALEFISYSDHRRTIQEILSAKRTCTNYKDLLFLFNPLVDIIAVKLVEDFTDYIGEVRKGRTRSIALLKRKSSLYDEVIEELESEYDKLLSVLSDKSTRKKFYEYLSNNATTGILFRLLVEGRSFQSQEFETSEDMQIEAEKILEKYIDNYSINKYIERELLEEIRRVIKGGQLSIIIFDSLLYQAEKILTKELDDFDKWMENQKSIKWDVSARVNRTSISLIGSRGSNIPKRERNTVSNAQSTWKSGLAPNDDSMRKANSVGTWADVFEDLDLEF